jgi:hypothetical protein
MNLSRLFLICVIRINLRLFFHSFGSGWVLRRMGPIEPK